MFVSRAISTVSHPVFRPFPLPIYSQLSQYFASQINLNMSTKTASGEQFEVRQTSATNDWHPDPSKSLPLSKERQALIDDIIALYSCQPTVERVKRYTPDCVYDDQVCYQSYFIPQSLILACSVCVR